MFSYSVYWPLVGQLYWCHFTLSPIYFYIIVRDKTIAVKLMYIPNDGTQITPSEDNHSGLKRL